MDVLELLDFARLYRTSVEWLLELGDGERATVRDGKRGRAAKPARLP